jgi:mannitol operon repressor
MHVPGRSSATLVVMKKPRVPSTPEDLKGSAAEFFDSIKGESDRGCVLVGASFLDEALELLLRSRMSTNPAVIKKSIDPLFSSGHGPLASFWAKTELCQALGLIEDWEYEDLMRIRKLRNLFAHSHGSAAFSDPQVTAITSSFSRFGATSFLGVTIADPRKSFVMAASWIAGRLHNRASMVKHDD